MRILNKCSVSMESPTDDLGVVVICGVTCTGIDYQQGVAIRIRVPNGMDFVHNPMGCVRKSMESPTD